MKKLAAYLKRFDVSRETLEKLELYHKLLLKWQKAINLVASKTIKEAETRHFLDSAQLAHFFPDDRPFKCVDMGSGGGFPPLVLAILKSNGDFHAIESDQRKGIFMETVSRETSTNFTVHKDRIENVSLEGVEFVTARALASLDSLLTYGAQFKPKTLIFLKGENYQQEIEDAKKNWHFDYDLTPSISLEGAQIIKITNLIEKD